MTRREKIFAVILVAAACVAATVYYPPYTYTYDGSNYFTAYQTGSSDIGVWEMEGGLANWLNSGQVLTQGGGTVAFPSVAGQVGNACAGPLGSTYVEEGTAMGLLSGGSAFTHAYRFKYVASSGSDVYTWSGVIDSGSSEELHIIVEGGTGALKLRLSRPSPPENHMLYGPNLTVGNWYSVAVDYTSGGDVHLTVNGTAYTYTPVTSFSVVPTGSWRLGEAYTGANQTNYYYDDVRLSKRVWSSGEMTAYMAGTLDSQVSPPPTYTPTPTPTYTATPYLTPTPGLMATPCGNPFPSAVWTPYASNPLFVPTTTPEADANFEPSVLPIGSTYYMTVSGGWSTPFVEICTSTDGLHFGARTTVMGQGVGGAPGNAHRATLAMISGQPIMYYSDDSYIWRATTSDGGTTWARQNIAVPGGVADAGQGWANFGCYQDPGTGYVWALVETVSKSTGNWELYPFLSTDGGVTFVSLGGMPVAGLHSNGVGASGARNIYKSTTTGLWHCWYHQQDTIYHGSSSDFTTWVADSKKTNAYSSSMWGITSVNQLVDACVLQVGDHVNLYCDATSNALAKGRIGVYQTGPMTLESFFVCAVQTPVPTPNPTNTPSYSWWEIFQRRRRN